MEKLDEYIEKFQKIYLEEFGEEISRDEAYDKFMRLVDFLRIVLQPLPVQIQDGRNPGSFSSALDRASENGRLEKHNN